VEGGGKADGETLHTKGARAIAGATLVQARTNVTGEATLDSALAVRENRAELGGDFMGTRLTLTAADGFRLGAYRADPRAAARAGIVVVQEIFGVNHHIRSVCDRVAAAGYRALAPQLFDRLVPNFESGYSEAEVARAREFPPKLDWAKVVLDTAAAVGALKREGPVAIMGFCMGGTVSFLAATRLDGLAAAVCYYGGQIIRHADNAPRCPTQMHFGEKDASIPLTDVETIRQKRPECEIHVYPGAGHAFSNDERANYEPNSARIAWERSLGFLARAFATATPMIRPKPKARAKAKSKPKRKAKSKRKSKKRSKAKRK
jgi:carboxymethylenebutenolidase